MLHHFDEKLALNPKKSEIISTSSIYIYVQTIFIKNLSFFVLFFLTVQAILRKFEKIRNIFSNRFLETEI